MSKTWFVTGAGRGIGAEIARAALAAGHRVVATGRDRDAIAGLFHPYGERVLALQLDVTQEAQATAAVEAAVARFGGIDVLVNNAGYGQLGAVEENSEVDIERQFATNLSGLFSVTRAVLPVMRGQRRGHVFNLSSVGGAVGYSRASIYGAAKFAMEGFSESLKPEMAPFGIHVTIVEPGFFHTGFPDRSAVRHGECVVDDTDVRRIAAEHRAFHEARNRRQADDPALLAHAIVRLASEAQPPLRYAAGSGTLAAIASRLAGTRDERERWRSPTCAGDHAETA